MGSTAAFPERGFQHSESSVASQHEVTNIGSDRGQLSGMARAAQEAMDKLNLKVYADRGYFNAPQIKRCADAA